MNFKAPSYQDRYEFIQESRLTGKINADQVLDGLENMMTDEVITWAKGNDNLCFTPPQIWFKQQKIIPEILGTFLLETPVQFKGPNEGGMEVMPLSSTEREKGEKRQAAAHIKFPKYFCIISPNSIANLIYQI